MSLYHSAVKYTFIDFDVALIYLLISLEPSKITGHITLIKILAGLIEFGTAVRHLLICGTQSLFQEIPAEPVT